ncbi:hypothetical protein [Mycobacterium sp.]|uniref:hypothetical protein n=1 Tax=Mycobacterium sp. TaxID=1785 RepID=UPI003C72F722
MSRSTPRQRCRHTISVARSAVLWLAETGGGDRLGYHGLRVVALLARAKAADIENFHVHKMRHSALMR